ncbi:MAG: sigma-70 family RNA polymerase sigma factor [Planctomycetota bacterium]|nr:sigma-70 family RNA polymerase sigma factor [Planctomycetota bacterium]
MSKHTCPQGTKPRFDAAENERRVQREELWLSYRKDECDRTRNHLVEYYFSFAKDLIRRFASRLPRSVDRGDLETAAHLGLMKAIVGFDPRHGVRFKSYCATRVRGSCRDELRTQDWLPRPHRQRLERQKRVVEGLRAELGREPHDEEVAGEMGLDIEAYERQFGVVPPGVPSGSMPLGATDDEPLLGLDAVPDPDGDAPGDRLSRDEKMGLILRATDEQERRILHLRYFEGWSMKDIGEALDLSESRVCKIHARLRERLKGRFSAQVSGD